MSDITAKYIQSMLLGDFDDGIVQNETGDTAVLFEIIKTAISSQDPHDFERAGRLLADIQLAYHKQAALDEYEVNEEAKNRERHRLAKEKRRALGQHSNGIGE